MFRKRLERFINHDLTELAVGGLIIGSIVLIVLEVNAPASDPLAERYSRWGSWITLLFVVELAIRWYVASSSRRFFRTYWLDVLAVVPLVRPLRILRVLRLLRLPRLCLMIARRTRRVAAVLSEGLAENLIIVVVLTVVFLIGAIGIRLVEPDNPQIDSFGNAVWWSLCTLMAGEPIFGEPSTEMGRLVTVTVMLGGFTIFAMFTGIVSAVMVDRLRGGMEAKEMELEELEDHFVICGWSRAAPAVIRELQANRETRERAIVVVAELEEEPKLRGAAINQGLLFFVRDDFTSTDVLRRVRVPQARAAILLADKSKSRADEDRDARTVLAALTMEKMERPEGVGARGKDLHTCVELLNRTKQKEWVLREAQVEDIVEGDEYVGNLVAHSIRAFGLVQVLDELLTSERGNEFEVQPLPPELDQCTFTEALRRFKLEQDRLVLGLVAGEIGSESGVRDRRTLLNPPSNQVLRAGQKLIVVTHPGARCAAHVPRKSRSVASALLDRPGRIRAASLAEVGDHCLICGWNRSAGKIIRQLHESRQTHYMPIVVVADPLPRELLEGELGDTVFGVRGDYVSPVVLEQARVTDARAAILLADKSTERSDQDRDARTILAALTIEKMRRGIHTCVELLNRDPEKVKVLKKANVEDVVVGDEYLGGMIAHATRAPGVALALDELLTSNFGNEFFKVPVPTELVGKPFGAAVSAFKERRDAIPVAVETRHCPDFDGLGEEPDSGEMSWYYVVNPPSGFALHGSDHLFVIARQWGTPEVPG